jgi:hypothetical protein
MQYEALLFQLESEIGCLLHFYKSLSMVIPNGLFARCSIITQPE